MSFHCFPFHFISFHGHFMSFHCIAFHFISFQFVSVQCISLLYTLPHFVSVSFSYDMQPHWTINIRLYIVQGFRFFLCSCLKCTIFSTVISIYLQVFRTTQSILLLTDLALRDSALRDSAAPRADVCAPSRRAPYILWT